jgi:ArsR family transcriptional regulator
LTIIYVLLYALVMDTTILAQSLPVTDATGPCCGAVVTGFSLDEPRSSTLAGRLKALADATRLRMLDLLAAQSQPLCVCDITSQFHLRQPTISHHLRILREAGLISGEKRGVWSYYWATEEGKQSLSLVKALA